MKVYNDCEVCWRPRDNHLQTFTVLEARPESKCLHRDSLASPDQEPGIAAGFGASLLLKQAATQELGITKGEEKQQPADQ